MSAGLVASGISKAYGRRRVVDGMSIQVHPGEIVGLLGPNGAGKTTAFHVIIGLTRPDEGRVSFFGRDITEMPMHARSSHGLGYLAQEPSIFQDLSVENNLVAVLESIIPQHAVRERARALLSEFGLIEHASRRAATLSGGERRRLEIARALATNPRCLMLDEPFANIDPLAIADLKSMIQLLKCRGIGVLVTDHNAREMMSIIDRAYLMADGQVFCSGTATELVDDTEARDRYFGHGFSI